jgi:uncharacterized protein DUF6228
MNAATEYHHHSSYQPLHGYFGELAESWRGWEGERSWRSSEGEIRLVALHNQLGTVTLTAQLRSTAAHSFARGGGYVWTASALLLLDAGGLDALARDALQLAA